ncbi:MAG: TlpA family protein disulfide reductase [Acidobacteria bacterium]|nr:TlpA family protein disulfide reductase [Acidobacteriota bacterium]
MNFNSTSTLRLTVCFSVILIVSMTISCSKQSVVEKGANNTASPASTYRPPNPAPTPVDSKISQYPVTMIDGGTVKISSLLGNNKVVLVNFWATWCGPCRREIPELIALQKELKDKGFEVIGLTVEDPAADQEKVRMFMQQYSINYKIGFSPKEMFLIFNGADPRGPIPQTFIFDKNGKLVDSVKGLRRDFKSWVLGAVNHALNNS